MFVASSDHTVVASDTSAGTELAKMYLEHGTGSINDVFALALAANGKFLAASTYYSILLLDTSTVACIGIIEDSERIWSVAISPDSTHLAAG